MILFIASFKQVNLRPAKHNDRDVHKTPVFELVVVQGYGFGCNRKVSVCTSFKIKLVRRTLFNTKNVAAVNCIFIFCGYYARERCNGRPAVDRVWGKCA